MKTSFAIDVVKNFYLTRKKKNDTPYDKVSISSFQIQKLEELYFGRLDSTILKTPVMSEWLLWNE